MEQQRPILTSRFLSKYELAKLAGIFFLELQSNRTSYELQGVDSLEEYSISQILERKYDVVLARKLPNGETEDVHLSNLRTEHLRL